MRKLKVGLGDTDAETVRKPTAPAAAAIPAPSSPQTPPSAFALHAPLAPSAPQAQQAPSARLAPRGPLPETPPQQQLRSPPAEPPSQPRSPFAEIQSQLRPSPTETPSRAPAKSPQPAAARGRGILRAASCFVTAATASGGQSVRTRRGGGTPARATRRTGARSGSARGHRVGNRRRRQTRRCSNSATLWSAGAGALVILLAAQIVNHYRNDLAATAQFNKPITALYAALGVHLTPRWDLHAYDVRQLGASVDSGERRPDHGSGQRQEWRAPAATHAAAASDFAGSLRQPNRRARCSAGKLSARAPQLTPHFCQQDNVSMPRWRSWIRAPTPLASRSTPACPPRPAE